MTKLEKGFVWTQIITGFLSLSAILLSTISLWGHVKGADVQMLAPSDITLFSDSCMQDKRYQFVEFIVPIVLVNLGIVGQNDFSVKARMVFTILDKEGNPLHGRKIQYYAYESVQTIRNRRSPEEFVCEEHEGNEFPGITIKSLGKGNMGVVNGGSGEGLEIHFVTDTELCNRNGKDCVPQKVLLTFEQFKKHAVANMSLQFDFYWEFYRSDPVHRSCTFKLHKATLDAFKLNPVVTTICNPVLTQ